MIKKRTWLSYIVAHLESLPSRYRRIPTITAEHVAAFRFGDSDTDVLRYRMVERTESTGSKKLETAAGLEMQTDHMCRATGQR